MASAAVLGLHAALAALFAASGPAPLYRDSLHYWGLAGEVAAGDPLLLEHPGATRTPGYPWLLAVFRIAAGEHALVAAVAFQELAVVATAGLVAWTVRRATGSARAALLALVLSLAGLSRHLLATYLWSDNALAVALTLHLAALLAWGRRPGTGRALLVGLSLGACALLRPVAQVAAVPALLAMGIHLRRDARRWLRQAGAVLAGLLLVLAPWIGRNLSVFGEPFLTRFHGRTLWISSFHPHAARLPVSDTDAARRALARAGPEAEPRDAWSVYAGLRDHGQDELAADDTMRSAALSAIAEHPGAFAASVAERFAWFWAVPYRIPRWRYDDPWVPLEGTWEGQAPWHSAAARSAQEALLGALWHPSAPLYAGSALVTALALAALLRRPDARFTGLAAGGLLACFGLATALFTYPLYRFRSILEPTMIAVVAMALAPWLERRVDRGRPSRAARRAPDEDATVTVLLPCKDPDARFLGEALRSVLAQTSPDWRLLVLADDPDAPVLEEVVGRLREPRIEIVGAEGGFARALNCGLARAKTAFVCILLGDDRLAPDAIAVMQREIRRQPDVDFFHSGRRHVDSQGRPISETFPPRESVELEHFVRVGSAVKHLMCFRREAALAIGGMDEELSPHGCDDYDFPWRMAEAGCRFGAVPQCLYEYRRHRSAPRLTTGVPLEEQVATLRRMFRKHGVSPRDTQAYVQRALETYLVSAHAESGVASAPRRLGVSCHAQAGPERRNDFVAAGFRARHFFPHRAVVLPRAGPDGAKIASRLFGVRDAGELHQLVLHALPPVVDEFPDALYFDDDIVWHRQHLGRRGHVAQATLVIRDGRGWGLTYFSDLVQRIGRRREHKTRIEARFQGWHRLLWNALLHVACERGLRELRSPTSGLSMRHTDRARDVGPELFERIYDAPVRERYEARREGGWWVLDVDRNRDRVVPLDRGFEVLDLPRTVCIGHDVERGLGHRDVDPLFARQAEREAPRALERMLAIERRAGVRATYHVVGALLPELRGAIEADGHALAFHSFDHAPGPAPGWRSRLPAWLGLSGRAAAIGRHEREQLRRCREVDYRLRGYRVPRSRHPAERDGASLAFFNFEWMASSAWSLGLDEPRLEGGIVRIPVRFDDYDLHTGRLDWRGFEQRLLAVLEWSPFVAVGLHDCYARHWLPHYEELLGKLRERARLATLDEVADETLLGSARWV